MKRLKPAIATTACAGIRRMEAGQPPALGMWTSGGKGAGQWQKAVGCANREHPFCNTSARKGTKHQTERPRLKQMKTACSTHFF